MRQCWGRSAFFELLLSASHERQESSVARLSSARLKVETVAHFRRRCRRELRQKSRWSFFGASSATQCLPWGCQFFHCRDSFPPVGSGSENGC